MRWVTSTGPDDFPMDFLYNLKSFVVFSLWLLFRQSLDENTYPNLLKLNSVTPILKIDYASLVNNYKLTHFSYPSYCQTIWISRISLYLVSIEFNSHRCTAWVRTFAIFNHLYYLVLCDHIIQIWLILIVMYKLYSYNISIIQ